MDLTNVPENAKAGLAIMNAETALAHVNASDVLEAYEHGASIPVQARALGVSHQAIYRKILKDAPELWKEHQAAHALAKLDDTETALSAAADGVAVSREREIARLQMWKLERVLRRIYGQDAPTVTVNLNLGNVGERIAQLEQELRVQRSIEGECSPTSPE